MSEAVELRELASLDVGRVWFEEPLAHHTTLRVGGPAEALVEPSTLDQLRRALDCACRADAPVTVLGGGSNLLVSDAGLRGLVVRLGSGFATVTLGEGEVSVGGGSSLNRLVRECARQGWSGLEFAIGIPGSVGGAVFGNAGALGGEVGVAATRVRCVDRTGTLREFTPAEAGFHYRGSGLAGQVVVSAAFPLTRADPKALAGQLRASLARRKATQPVDKLNAGCIFRNPPQGPAGRLIEAMGGKGMRVGAAVVSSLHANFIVNEGGARASEVLELIDLLRARCRAYHGFDLQPEIRIAGADLAGLEGVNHV